MKKGIQTGHDNEGRFFTDFSEDKVQQMIAKSTAFEVVDTWETEDGLGKIGAIWLNVIIKMK